MGRQPCCEKSNGLRRGPWTVDEDHKLITFILNNGIQCWRTVPKLAGLMRCGKSCRLRWINYLRPDLKRGAFSEAEEDMIIQLHARLGNRWSKIATHLPGRTDNEIKNHWNTRIKKKLKLLGLDPQTHKPIAETINPEARTDQHENSTHSSSSLSIPMKPEFSFHSGIKEDRKLSTNIPTGIAHTSPGITEMGLVMNHGMEPFGSFSMGLGHELIPQNFWIDESPSQWDVFNDPAGLGGL